jgi:hypothetical protein
MQYIRFVAPTSSKMDSSDHETNRLGWMRARMPAVGCRLQTVALHQRGGHGE